MSSSLKKKIFFAAAVIGVAVVVKKKENEISSLKKELKEKNDKLDTINQLKTMNEELVKQVRSLGYSLGMERYRYNNKK